MNLVTRAQWGARQATATPALITPSTTTGHWEGGGIWGGVIGPHESCAPKVRAIQAYHMDHQGWTDIAYNGLGCPHGYVFEGRGPGRRSAANGTNTANGASHAMCYLGGVGDPFTEGGMVAMVDGAAWLGTPLEHCHSDWFQTECCGLTICGWIRSGHPLPHPMETDMTPGQCRDKQGRKWHFYLDSERKISSTLNGAANGRILANDPGWTSGLDAFCEADGTITVCGRAANGRLAQVVFVPGGPPALYNELEGHVYP